MDNHSFLDSGAVTDLDCTISPRRTNTVTDKATIGNPDTSPMMNGAFAYVCIVCPFFGVLPSNL